MPKPMVYLRHPLKREEDEAFQTFGDMVFYPNGGVRLGGKWFAYRSAIHRHRFGANLVALRSVNDLNALEVETAAGGRLRFRYHPIFRTWHQVVEVHDPRLYLHQQRYGTLPAIGLYYARWCLRWAAIQALTLLGFFMLGVLIVLVALASKRFF